MTLEPADVAALVALIVAGPWGLVLIVALFRGYDLRVSMKRRRLARRDDDDDLDDDDELDDRGAP